MNHNNCTKCGMPAARIHHPIFNTTDETLDFDRNKPAVIYQEMIAHHFSAIGVRCMESLKRIR